MRRWEKDLVKDIRTHTYVDDMDAGWYGHNNELSTKLKDGSVEFTVRNHIALQNAINCCKRHGVQPRVFVEIGVCRNGSQSSTHTIIKNLPENGIYLGVDIEDKSFLDDGKRIFTIKTSSSNYQKVVNKLTSLGVTLIDFLFIDGWHSINQVLDDWEYVNGLSLHGVVAFHDTTHHPGPYYFINNLNTEKWVVHPNECPEDYGLGYCYYRD